MLGFGGASRSGCLGSSKHQDFDLSFPPSSQLYIQTSTLKLCRYQNITAEAVEVYRSWLRLSRSSQLSPRSPMQISKPTEAIALAATPTNEQISLAKPTTSVPEITTTVAITF